MIFSNYNPLRPLLMQEVMNDIFDINIEYNNKCCYHTQFTEYSLNFFLFLFSDYKLTSYYFRLEHCLGVLKQK